jgi:hypothetical protein
VPPSGEFRTTEVIVNDCGADPDAIQTLARPNSQSLKSIAPPPNTLRHTLPESNSPPLSFDVLLRALAEIPKLRFEELHEPRRVQVMVHDVTWTRAARRRLSRNTTTAEHGATDAPVPIMVSEISVVDEHILEVRWIRGKDRGVFESFWGHLSGKLS